MADPADCDPFEMVTITRERDAAGNYTGWYLIVGERQGGERSRRVLGTTLLDLAEQRVQRDHSVDERDGLLAHAILPAAVAWWYTAEMRGGTLVIDLTK